jgi:hypothetical protein
MKITSTWAIAIALGLGLTTSVIGAPRGSGSPGNSAFGRNQQTDLHTGSGNSAYGRTTSANARLRSDDLADEDDVDRVNTRKTKKTKHTWSSYPGNSAFGRNQRINHLKGSGNNVHGKTVSANAKAKHAKNR